MANLRKDPNDPLTPITSTTTPAFLSEAAVDEYWYLVERTLTDVFGEMSWEAKRKVQELKKKIDSTPQVDKLYWYHVDPLQVAADLTNNAYRPLTEIERRTYNQLRAANGSEPLQDAVYRVPDDFNE